MREFGAGGISGLLGAAAINPLQGRERLAAQQAQSFAVPPFGFLQQGCQSYRPRKKVECKVVELESLESAIPHSTHLLYGGG